MDVFKRKLAPLTDEAWNEISAEAARTLRSILSGRRVVDVDGPNGMAFSAVNLGRLALPDEQGIEGIEGVQYGIRRVLPLVEVRVPFQVEIWELDNLARGARDVDLGAVVEAARRLAIFEDRAILTGLARGEMQGLAQAASTPPRTFGGEPSAVVDAVSQATVDLRDAGVGGPYAVVLGRKPWHALHAALGYPAERRVEAATGGPILFSPALEGGLLVSMRGNDFTLTLGQDATLGYSSHDHERVRLYLTESFALQVQTPGAIIPFS